MQYAAALTSVRTVSCGGDRSRPARIPERARMAAPVAMSVLVAAALLVSIMSLANDTQAPLPASWGTVSVSQSATLWGIAEAHPIAGRSTVDTVELICAENGLADGIIHTGQVLRVPVQAPTAAVAQR